MKTPMSKKALVAGLLGFPFDSYVARVVLSTLRWRRFWLISPPSCMAWAYLLAASLGLALAARTVRLRSDLVPRIGYSIPSWTIGGGRGTEEAEVARRVQNAPQAEGTFRSLFPDALVNILEQANVPRGLRERYLQRAAEGSETHFTVVLETKIPRGAATRDAEAKARAGTILGSKFPEIANRIIEAELDVWRSIDHPQIPGWPREFMQTLEDFDRLAVAVAEGWQREDEGLRSVLKDRR